MHTFWYILDSENGQLLTGADPEGTAGLTMVSCVGRGVRGAERAEYAETQKKFRQSCTRVKISGPDSTRPTKAVTRPVNLCGFWDPTRPDPQAYAQREKL